MISCKKATMLITQQEGRQLNLVEKFQLNIHLKACELCRRFRDQSRWLAMRLQNDPGVQDKLSEEKKQALRDMLEGN